MNLIQFNNMQERLKEYKSDSMKSYCILKECILCGLSYHGPSSITSQITSTSKRKTRETTDKGYNVITILRYGKNGIGGIGHWA